ncbi:MAG: DUF262 domain-containing protein [Clostridia bacterium]|nr:DUF262 domain-containing protein [Clostridia bacterium]
MGNGLLNISQLLEDYIVWIPEIQRDYAQGRANAEAVRNKLLDDVFEVLTGEKEQHVFNYIYGVPTDKGRIVLIDGQQRVTTLFLLKWYFAKKANVKVDFLERLEYATRDSSRDFCAFLKEEGAHLLDDAGVPSEVITNHTKFKKRWLNDPTIVNMLNMLDAIDQKANALPCEKTPMYEKVNNMYFSFISLDGFQRTDELYAAMNSRGKQLTPFELIKGDLLKAAPDLAAIINGEWLPTFWALAKQYGGENGDLDAEAYAAINHDPFLYRYFAFLVQMIWWETSDMAKQIKKGDHLPAIAEMTRQILDKKENINLIKFSMDLVSSNFVKGDCFDELVRYDHDKPIESNHIVIFEGRPSDDVDFFKLCCCGEKDFTQASRCYLWAYIRYQYDVACGQVINGRSLYDYYLLMRALYMWRASNNTPTSVDKLSLNEELMGDVVESFAGIICDDPNYKEWSQYKAFYSNNSKKYELLNNPLVRGATDNIKDIQDDYLNDNLKWLALTDKAICFRRLLSCGFGYFKCGINGYSDRVFLPCTEKMLQSLFSLRGWNNSDDYVRFLEYLRKNKLEDQSDVSYSADQWEYYFIKYESFQSGSYGQFKVSDENDLFSAVFIENERATKNKIRNPFLNAVYQLKRSGEISYYDFVKNNQLEFAKTSNGFEWKWNGETYAVNLSEDCIEAFVKDIDKTRSSMLVRN